MGTKLVEDKDKTGTGEVLRLGQQTKIKTKTASNISHALQPEGPCEMFDAVLVLIFVCCPCLSTSPVHVLSLSSTNFVSIVTLSPCTTSDEQWSEKLYRKPNSVWCLKFKEEGQIYKSLPQIF